jgi:hypothetical protein
MSLKTYSDLKSFVQDKLDLRDEDFINDAELLSYTEEALKYCEAEIHKLDIEDQYFATVAPIAVSFGKSDYKLPDNIYGHKILRLVYSNETDIHDIPRMTNLQRFSLAELQRKYGSTTEGSLMYMLVNSDPRVGTRIRFYPTPQETVRVLTSSANSVAGSATITGMTTAGMMVDDFIVGPRLPFGTRILSVDSPSQITMSEVALTTGNGSVTVTEPRILCWYIRSVSIPQSNADFIDFPEFWYFIAQHVVVNCLKKEIGNPRLAVEIEALKELKQQMHDTLANMVPDQDDEIEKDVSHYNDMGEYM